MTESACEKIVRYLRARLTAKGVRVLIARPARHGEALYWHVAWECKGGNGYSEVGLREPASPRVHAREIARAVHEAARQCAGVLLPLRRVGSHATGGE